MIDLVIIGAGPAGLTALLYASLYCLSIKCFGNRIGGKLLDAPGIIDYPGTGKISGTDFSANLHAQVIKTGAVVENKRISEIAVISENKACPFLVTDVAGVAHETKTILLCCGNPNKQADQQTVAIFKKLQLEMRNKLLVVNERYMTNQPGIFAAGDGIVYPYSLEQLITSVTTGVQAAASIFEFVKHTPPPILWGQARIPRMFVERKNT